MPKDFKIISGPVRLIVNFNYPIQQATSKKVRNQLNLGLIQIYRNSKPDIDNLQKSLFDALKGTIILDDNQIVDIHVKKFNTLEPSTEIELEIINNIIPKHDLKLIN